jgi:cysteinyl-tRNA synthetase
MDNDLNTPGAFASIFDMIGEVNTAIEKDFKHADEIRKRLEDMDIVLEDTKEGVRWRKK